MKLEEAFEKYNDDIEMKRKLVGASSYPIGWLRQMKAWGNEESRSMGFIIPQAMMDDANANDWEVSE